MKRTKLFLFVFGLYFLLGLVVYYNLLQFGLASDDLRVIYYIRSKFLVTTINSFKFYPDPYFGQFAITSLNYFLHGLNPLPYYLTSLILRILPSVSVFFVGLNIFKSKYQAHVAGLFSLLSSAGLQSNWPVNSSVHISVILMNIGLIYLIKNKRLKATIYLFASFAMYAARMHGLIPLLLLSETFSLIFEDKKYKTLLSLLVFVLGIFILRLIGFFENSWGNAVSAIELFTNPEKLMQLDNFLGVVFYSFSVYSKLLIPDFLMQFIQSINLQFLIIIYAIIIYISGSKIKSYKKLFSVIIFFILILLTETLLLNQPISVKYHLYNSSLILAIFSQMIIFDLIRKNYLSSKIKLLILAIPAVFMIIPFISYPFSDAGIESRYYSVSLIGISLLVGYFYNFIKHKGAIFKLIFFVILLNIFVINISNSREYITYYGDSGSYQKYIHNSFTIMNSEIGSRTNKSRPIVYLKSDGSPFSFVAIVEGGQERFSLLNNDLSENVQPIFVYDINELTDIYKKQQFPFIDDIDAYYGYEIENNKIISITEEVRDILIKS